jgi:hypothetical protein
MHHHRFNQQSNLERKRQKKEVHACLIMKQNKNKKKTKLKLINRKTIKSSKFKNAFRKSKRRKNKSKSNTRHQSRTKLKQVACAPARTKVGRTESHRSRRTNERRMSKKLIGFSVWRSEVHSMVLVE